VARAIHSGITLGN